MKEADKGLNQATLAISSAGNLFTRLVLEGWHTERINTLVTSDYLEVRTKHLAKIENQVFAYGNLIPLSTVSL